MEDLPPPPISYEKVPEPSGCGPACLLHLVMLSGVLTLLTMWIIRNKAWELEFTVKPKEAPKAEVQEKAEVKGEK